MAFRQSGRGLDSSIQVQAAGWNIPAHRQDHTVHQGLYRRRYVNFAKPRVQTPRRAHSASRSLGTEQILSTVAHEMCHRESPAYFVRRLSRWSRVALTTYPRSRLVDHQQRAEEPSWQSVQELGEEGHACEE